MLGLGLDNRGRTTKHAYCHSTTSNTASKVACPVISIDFLPTYRVFLLVSTIVYGQYSPAIIFGRFSYFCLTTVVTSKLTEFIVIQILPWSTETIQIRAVWIMLKTVKSAWVITSIKPIEPLNTKIHVWLDGFSDDNPSGIFQNCGDNATRPRHGAWRFISGSLAGSLVRSTVLINLRDVFAALKECTCQLPVIVLYVSAFCHQPISHRDELRQCLLRRVLSRPVNRD
jgi:hypothetical protein